MAKQIYILDLKAAFEDEYKLEQLREMLIQLCEEADSVVNFKTKSWQSRSNF